MKIYKTDLVYPELSYRIIGCAFGVHNELGPGHTEKIYQTAMARAFEIENIKYDKEIYCPIIYHDKVIGKFFFDFLVEKQIVVELKRGEAYSRQHIEQVSEYLKVGNYQLGILINFGEAAVKFKRIINVPLNS